VIEVEVFGAARPRAGAAGSRHPARPGSAEPPPPSIAEVRRLCILAAGSAGVREGHMAVEFVDAGRIAELNAEHRDEPKPTDVLAFPMDAVESVQSGGRPRTGEVPTSVLGESGAGERSTVGQSELGDVVICPEYTVDLREAIVHGVLHLVGMDHETDDGEMLALQRELLARASR
jgi:probable rRNA maturation factor